MWLLLQSVSQEQRERKVTVDEIPSGIYLYPEEEAAVDNMFTPVSSRSSAAVFEEAQKEVLRLMRIEVCFVFSFIHLHKVASGMLLDCCRARLVQMFSLT